MHLFYARETMLNKLMFCVTKAFIMNIFFARTSTCVYQEVACPVLRDREGQSGHVKQKSLPSRRTGNRWEVKTKVT